jgi:hypothetical protein
MKEEIRLLENCTHEIKRLRNQNTLMKTRLDMFDDVLSILHAKTPSKGDCFTPDLVFEVEEFIKTKNLK